MAGIGFSLRRMLNEDETYPTRVRAWFHTAMVSAGPWIISIIIINILLVVSRNWDIPFAEKEMLIASIIYSTLFSQLLSAPFQMIITRYIADRMYAEELAFVKPSFWGISFLMMFVCLIIGLLFVSSRPLPQDFSYLLIALFIIMCQLWILYVYISTLRNFTLITIGNLLGGIVTLVLIAVFYQSPIQFAEYTGVSNLLFAYTAGMFFILVFLLMIFLVELKEDNGRVFHFIRYFHSVPSLWPIGLFYTAAVWVDNLIMWFSPISVVIYESFRYAPMYDIASFYAYLSIIPSNMLFIVLIETDFSVKIQDFFKAVVLNHRLDDLERLRRRMTRSLFENILQTVETQMFITVLLIILSRDFFPLLGVPEQTRSIFAIYALGAFCNAFILIVVQTLLYVGERNRALILVSFFLGTNIIFTYQVLQWGENFYGFGFFISGFLSMIFGFVLLYLSYKRVIMYTFLTQPVFVRKREKFFERMETKIDSLISKKKILAFIPKEQREEAVEFEDFELAGLEEVLVESESDGLEGQNSENSKNDIDGEDGEDIQDSLKESEVIEDRNEQKKSKKSEDRDERDENWRPKS